MLRKYAGAFFSARQLSFQPASNTVQASWFNGKMLAFQPRGFVFDPRASANLFTSIPKQKVLTSAL